IHRPFAVDLQQLLVAPGDIGFGLFGRRIVGRNLVELGLGHVVAHGVGQHEVTVGQPLHQGTGSQPVGSVVGAVGFTDHKHAGHSAFQVVVNPRAAHGVVHRRVAPHRHFGGVFAG